MRTTKGNVTAHSACVLAFILATLSGIGYRFLTCRLGPVFGTEVKLPIALSAFPAKIGNWVSQELPIPLTTKEYMEKHFADDFLSRRYINTETEDWADVYIVYCSSRPGSILGHRPGVCYPANGWVHDSTELSQLISQTGRQIPCLIHRFHKPAPLYHQTVVLHFYILNGRVTANESDFSGLLYRRTNIAGDPARYVVQVQISSVQENTIVTAVKDMADLILDFLPDESGQTRVKEYTNTASAILK